MKPIKFKEQNRTLTKPENMTNEQCGPLPVYNDGDISVSRWEMTFAERLKALFTGKAWLCVWGGTTQPPVHVGINSPLKKEKCK